MAIEFFDGFELMTHPWWASSNIGTPGRSGTKSLRSSGGGDYTARLNLPPSVKKVVGFAYWVDNMSLWTDGVSYPISFYSNGVQHITITFNAIGNILVRLGSNGGTVLATSTQTSTTAAWHYLEVAVTIHDTTGTVVVRMDGVGWINFTGDTRNGGTVTTIDQLNIGYRNAGAGYSSAHDDFYVLNETDATATTGRADNTFLGDVKVEMVQPNADGATSQWVGSDGNSVQNYLLVDENPVNTTDYVGSATDGDRDLWGLPDIPASTLTVYAILPSVYASKSDAGAASLKIIYRDNAGTVAAGSSQALTTGWAWYLGGVLPTKPSGGAWTVADINALQLGVEKA